MSICNYCTLKWIKAEAEKKHQIVTIKESNFDGVKEFNRGNSGTDVFVDGKFVAWLMEITSECAC